MDDREIVAGVRLGDRDAVARLYDRYADVLHDFARRRVHSQADASRVVHDAFLVGLENIEQLRNPDRLRPWLFAIARTELHRRYRQAARYVELDTRDEERQPASRQPVSLAVRAERAEVVRLLRTATAGLADADRELLDLHLRHGLVGDDLAAAAGLPPRQAAVALDRVKDRLTRTLGVVLLSRRPVCDEFAAIWDAQHELTPLARKRLARHVDECESCSEEYAHRLRPEAVLSAVPLLPAPPELRRRLVAGPARGAPGDQFWDGEGFPWPSRPRHRWLAWMAAAAAVLLLMGGAVVLARPLVTERGVAAGPRTPTPTGTAGGTASGTTSEAPTSDGLAASGGVLTSTTTTTAGTTTDRVTTTAATTRSTTPSDAVPPDIGAVSLKPTTLATALTSGAPSCSTHPPSATTTVVSVPVTDPSGVAAVTMIWSAGGSAGTVTMSPGPRDSYTGTAGPVDAGNLAAGGYDLTVTVVARDGLGNEIRRTAKFGQAVSHCGAIR